ncbi:MAG TPA: DHA2 family efflux MFS transporter permease subunit [Gemmatimonadales bacterium]|jgi:DHA2 family multidrug resistance protein
MAHTAKSSAKAPQSGRASRPDAGYRWRALTCVVFGIFMVILDTTVVNVAFPTIRSEFHASLAGAQWIVSLYVLSLGITTPLAGYLSDRFGIKRMYLGALGVFVVGSICSGLAPSLGVLMLARALQGAGGGVALPLGVAMLFEAFPPEEQGVALGFYGVAIVFAPALGPILGGLLIDHGLWRWIFFLNIPIGAIGITMGALLLREGKARRATTLDRLGLVLAVVGFGATLFAASIAAGSGWTSLPVLESFSLGVVALTAFVVVELFHARDPLLDFRLFRNRVFVNASVVGWVSVLALFGAEFLLPNYLQVLRGLSALQSGLTVLPLAIAAGIVTPIAGRLYDRIGPRTLAVAGFVVLCVNTFQLSELTGETSLAHIRFLMAMRGVALGLTVQSTFTAALGTVQRSRVARGSSLLNSMRFVVQSAGVALLATLLASSQSPQTRQLLQHHGGSVASTAQQHGEAASAAASRQEALCAPAEGPTQAGASRLAAACQESLRGYGRAYRFTFYMAILALLLGAWLPGWPFGWHGRGRESAAAT